MRIFQSTPSVWRETLNECCSGCHVLFQSTPSVWRETKVVDGFTVYLYNFNPLPPCGGRPDLRLRYGRQFLFQSTPSVWRETPDFSDLVFYSVISIHSLRVEGDREVLNVSLANINFNPLPPCGGRPVMFRFCPQYSDFNPLPPCGGRPSSVISL